MPRIRYLSAYANNMVSPPKAVMRSDVGLFGLVHC